MLNTFFFGYLSLKWKRLFRTLIIVAYFFWGLVAWDEAVHYGWINYNRINEERIISSFDIDDFILLISIPIVSIALISWVIKPFIVKEDS